MRGYIVRGLSGAPYLQDIKNKKPDGVITLGKGVVKACIEYKIPRQLATSRKIAAAIEQERSAARFLCNLLIVTDGTRTFWINPHTGNRIIFARPPPPTFDAKALVAGTATGEELRRIEQTIDEADHSLSPTNDSISSPTLLDPTQLARTIWQKIWINTGKEPEKCLYNVVELFVFRFLSDLGVLEAHNNFAQVYELGKAHGREAALTSYAQLSRQAIRNLFPEGSDHLNPQRPAFHDIHPPRPRGPLVAPPVPHSTAVDLMSSCWIDLGAWSRVRQSFPHASMGRCCMNTGCGGCGWSGVGY